MSLHSSLIAYKALILSGAVKKDYEQNSLKISVNSKAGTLYTS